MSNGIVTGCDQVTALSKVVTKSCDVCDSKDTERCPAKSRIVVTRPAIDNTNVSISRKSTSQEPTISVYQEVAIRIATLVEQKQLQYGDSFGNSHKILEILYPEGIQKEDYQNLLTVVRIIDKLFRIANGDQGNESAWQDITGYGLLAASHKKD